MARKFSQHNKFWRRGELTRLSVVAGIRLSALSGIFHRHIGISPRRALHLRGAIREVTGKDVSFADLVFSKKSNHPCFF